LRDAIDAFIEAYNQQSAPFQGRKAKVHPKSLITYDAWY
jgi:hypothetical protein